MIQESIVQKLIDTYLEDKDFFLVDMAIDSANKIRIEIDRNEGVKIKDCVDLSRHIEHSLDRESNDFELQVSSPGMGQALKVFKQYLKSDGKKVDVKLKSGESFSGVLRNPTEEGYDLEVSKKVKVEGKKKKQEVTETMKFKFEEIESTKRVVTFK